MPEPSVPQRASAVIVTIRLMNGAEIKATVAAFSARAEEFEVTPLGAPGRPPPRALRVRANTVACVCFHRRPRAPLHPPPDDGRLYRVHVAGGRSFEVLAASRRVEEKRGFTGFSTHPDQPFERFYFYAHGIVACEEPTPTGTLLVERAAVAPAVVKAGLEAQKNGRKLRLGQVLVEDGATSEAFVQGALGVQRGDASAMDTLVQVRAPAPVKRDLQAFAAGCKASKLGEILVDLGLLGEAELSRALRHQLRCHDRRLGEVLVDLGLVDEPTLQQVLADKFSLETVDLVATGVDAAVAARGRAGRLRELQVLPYAKDGETVLVAITDPLAHDALEEVRGLVGAPTRPLLARPSQLRQALDDLWAQDPDSLVLELTASLDDVDRLAGVALGQAAPGPEEITGILRQEACSPAVERLLNQVLKDALTAQASDVHLSPRADGLHISLRLHGELKEQQVLDPRLASRVVARAKIVAGMDVAVRDRPQEGRLAMRQGAQRRDLLVSTLPTLHGESVVLRVAPAGDQLDLTVLGFAEHDVQALRRMCLRRFGLVLCTGPGGSGPDLHPARAAQRALGRAPPHRLHRRSGRGTATRRDPGPDRPVPRRRPR